MLNRIASIFVACLVLVVLSSASIALSQEVVIVSSKVGECTLSVEVRDNEPSLIRLRAHHPEYRSCQIDKGSVLSLLTAAFSRTEAPRPEGSYTSLYIGRLIDYPWLSQYLAVTARDDKTWNKKRGKPVSIDINKYVSGVLSKKEVIDPMDTVFAKHGYKVARVTVEKVLVGSLREVPLYQGKLSPGRVPYDAQVWFRLQKK